MQNQPHSSRKVPKKSKFNAIKFITTVYFVWSIEAHTDRTIVTAAISLICMDLRLC